MFLLTLKRLGNARQEAVRAVNGTGQEIRKELFTFDKRRGAVYDREARFDLQGMAFLLQDERNTTMRGM